MLIKSVSEKSFRGMSSLANFLANMGECGGWGMSRSMAPSSASCDSSSGAAPSGAAARPCGYDKSKQHNDS